MKRKEDMNAADKLNALFEHARLTKPVVKAEAVAPNSASAPGASKIAKPLSLKSALISVAAVACVVLGIVWFKHVPQPGADMQHERVENIPVASNPGDSAKQDQQRDQTVKLSEKAPIKSAHLSIRGFYAKLDDPA